MKRTLSEVVRDWEIKHGFTVRTLENVKKGTPVKPTTAYQVAIAFGCSDKDAREYAAQAQSDAQEPPPDEAA